MDSFRKSITGKRYAAGSWLKGRWVEGSISVISLTASVQPVTPEAMQTVPELRRSEATFSLFTSFRLRAADVVATTNADRVTINGAEYEVLSVAVWQNDVIPHYVAVVGTIKGPQ